MCIEVMELYRDEWSLGLLLVGVLWIRVPELISKVLFWFAVGALHSNVLNSLDWAGFVR